MDFKAVAEFLVVVICIVMGVRMGGAGLGIWGVAGVAILVFVFGLAPGAIPGSAVLIIIAVITAASAMQAAGGIDYLVRLAAKIIRANPKRITFIAPLVSFIFTVGAGTSNIFYPLIPVIYETAYSNDIRPERPLAVSTVANALGITCSPVSAAMAAMLTLVAIPEYGNFALGKILIITIPASLVAIIVTAIVQNFIGKPLAEDPVYQERLKNGQVAPPKPSTGEESEAPLPKGAALSAYLFLVGVLLIVLTAFPQFQKMVPGTEGEMVALGTTNTIVLIMFVVALLILMFTTAKVADVTKQQVFSAGIIAILALLGIAWLADTFVSAYYTEIVTALGDAAATAPLFFALAIFVLAALTTSQSATTRTLVPIGLAILPVAPVVAMWQAVSGVLFLPANGTQLAAVAVDQTGTTKIGKAVVNHSFMIPLLVCTVVAVGVGLVIATIAF